MAQEQAISVELRKNDVDIFYGSAGDYIRIFDSESAKHYDF